MSVARTAKRNVFSRDLKDPSESLSLTVLGKVFQVCGAEKRYARVSVVGAHAKVELRVVSVLMILHAVVCDGIGHWDAVGGEQ